MSETVLEQIDFDADNFWCIEGGTQQVATGMAEKLVKKPEFHRKVTAISQNMITGRVSLDITQAEHPDRKKETREYFAVLNSTTLGALQRMDLTKANLSYGTKQAIRSLGYGASCKVGIKFKSAWWMKEPLSIDGGGISKTDRPLRVCVYPSYNVDDAKDKPAVLLCSYTWAQDAQRVGALITPHSPEGEDELRDLLLENLARLHAKPGTVWDDYKVLLEHLKDEYVTHYAWDWYADDNMAGAFAYFGPQQFSKMWPEIIRNNGWLFFIGEAASAHHAWIVGSLESAVRAVNQLLSALVKQAELYGIDPQLYRSAMEKLKEDVKELPFGPLPEEMPKDQKEVSEMKYPAAEVVLGFLEELVDVLLAESAADVKPGETAAPISTAATVTAH